MKPGMTEKPTDALHWFLDVKQHRTVILRSLPQAGVSKDGERNAATHPSRLATLAPQDDGGE